MPGKRIPRRSGNPAKRAADLALPKMRKQATASVMIDPLGTLPIGHSITINGYVFSESDAKEIPDTVRNWEELDGTVLAVGIRSLTGVKMIGSAVRIGIGLAVTATHVLADHLDEILAGTVTPFAMGIRSGIVEFWIVRMMHHSPDDDTQFLSLELNSRLHPSNTMSVFPITTRCPVVNEELTILGFRFEDKRTIVDRKGNVSFAGALHAARGLVTQVFLDKRDSVMVRFPAIEIACGCVGSMSGGAVIDATGKLVGIVSVAVDTDDGLGPTTASWIGPVLGRPVQCPWPPGTFPTALPAAEYNPFIEGAEYLETSPVQTVLKVWH